MPTTTNFGWTTPADTDLVKDGAAAIRTLGNGIDTSLVDLKGGTTDQVLAKNSNTDMDFKWVTSDDANAIQNAIVDAKGDLIAASGADTPARLAVGTNEHRLVAASGETTGLKYVADTTNYAIAAKGDLLVGTAADTLQALSVGTNGYTLVADSAQTTGIKWAAPSGGGLVLITTSTLSAVNSVSFNDCFSSTYDAYRILLNLTGSTNIGVYFRFRNDGTDYTGASYERVGLEVDSSALVKSSATGQTSLFLGAGRASSKYSSCFIDVFDPINATYKAGLSNFTRSYNNVGYQNFWQYGSSDVADGFTILTDSGQTMTGTIYVYGYAK